MIKKTLEQKFNIPVIYESFPKDFKLDVMGWSFPDDKKRATIDVDLNPEEISELKKSGLIDRMQHLSGKRYRIRRLRTLDIEIGSDNAVEGMNDLKERYGSGEFRLPEGSADKKSLMNEFGRLYRQTCTQRCPHCFNQEDSFYVDKILSGHELMKWSETKGFLKEAKRFGLESIKFLGIGEIFKNPDLFNILDDLKELDLHIGIFTKGTALGDDKTAKGCGYQGVETAEDLVKRLSRYDNVSVLLGANSFDPKKQDEMVGCGKNGGIMDYTKKRDRALELLVEHGFNNPDKRLSLIAAPVTPMVSDETVEMYEWAIRRNMPVITIPTMLSGKGADELEWLFSEFENNNELIDRFDPERKMTREERYTEWLVDFYTAIYSRGIDIGIHDLKSIQRDGISGYAGTAKCQQKHNGMYIRLPGTVQECPGRSVGTEIAGDLREQPFIRTWVGSRNYVRSKDCRSLCAVKMKDITESNVKVCDCCVVYDNVGSMPLELEEQVIERLTQKYSR